MRRRARRNAEESQETGKDTMPEEKCALSVGLISRKLIYVFLWLTTQ